MGRRTIAIYSSAVGVIAFIVGAVLYLKTATYIVALSVDSLTWRRVFNIEVYKQVAGDSLAGYEPADAYQKEPYVHIWIEQVYCGEVSHQSCSGIGKTRSCTTYYTSRYCPMPRSENRVRYIVDRWVYDHDLVTTDRYPVPRWWPDFRASPEQKLGAEREAKRYEVLTVNYRRSDNGLTLSNDMPDEPTWLTWREGQRCTVEINRSEEPQWATVKRVDPR